MRTEQVRFTGSLSLSGVLTVVGVFESLSYSEWLQSRSIIAFVDSSLILILPQLFVQVLFSETTEGLAQLCMAALRTSNLNLLSTLDSELSSSVTPATTTSRRCAFDNRATSVHFETYGSRHANVEVQLRSLGL